jgi:putative PIN family toxin of toxin-antitoxin system
VTLVATFDTNILFSGLGWRGAPHECLNLARLGHVEHVTCEEILAELAELLVEKLDMTADEAARAIAELKSFARLVPIPNQLSGVVADPDDHKVLECAVAGAATHIVTGDRRHLLPLGQYNNIRILSAADFLTAAAEEARTHPHE